MSVSPVSSYVNKLGGFTALPIEIIEGVGAPSTAFKRPVGAFYYDTTTQSLYGSGGVVNNAAVWIPLGGTSVAISNVLGTANQITSTVVGGVATLSLPAAVQAPGSVTAATGLTATTGGVTASAGNIVATLGNITASAGNIAATLGSVSAGTTVTAGTGISSTLGNIVATAGNVSATLGSVSAGTTVTAGTGISSTLGNITAAAGDFVATLGNVSAPAGSVSGNTVSATTTVTAGTDLASTAGNVLINGSAKQLRVKGGAVTDFIGNTTLVAGTVTIANTNIAAGDQVYVTRSGINGSTKLGVFEVTIAAGASFTINSYDPATALIEANDVSLVKYFIVRAI